jgi:hypothetical protein
MLADGMRATNLHRPAGVLSRAILRRVRVCVALAPLSAAAGLAGCGSSAPAAKVSGVATVTPSGLHYSFRLTVRDGKACATETYAGVGTKRKPFTQSQQFCGPSGQGTPPTLIQVTRPAAVLILDRPASCATVTVARGHRSPVPASSECSVTLPHLRLTLLPAGHSFTIGGIPGVRQIDLAKLPCSFICTRELTGGSG